MRASSSSIDGSSLTSATSSATFGPKRESSSGERHARLRGSVLEAFTPRAVNRLRPVMRETVSDLLDEWAHIAHELQALNVQLQYQTETGAAQRLLYEFLSPELKKLPKRHDKFRAKQRIGV